MILARRATLRPSSEQSAAFGRACGVARVVWNWGLSRKREAWDIRKAAIDSGISKKDAPKVPTYVDLCKELTLLKKKDKGDGGFSWMYESSSDIPTQVLRDLDDAFSNFFRRIKLGEKTGYPRFKSRNKNPGHFRVQDSYVKNGKIHISRVGHVRFMPGDVDYIPDGTYKSASIVEDGDNWCVSIHIEVPEAIADSTRPIVGLDAGVRELAHLSDGTVIPNPCALVSEVFRFQKLKRSIARKQRAVDKKIGKRAKRQRREDSNRLKRARKKLAKIDRRVKNIRTDALHKATTWIAKTYDTVSVEILSGKNMTKRAKGKGRAAKAGLNRAILDSGMLRLRSLLKYKMPLNGGHLVEVPAAYTSRECSSCHERNNPGSSKTYTCAYCGLVIDRDHNASLNILAAASCTVASLDENPATRRGATVRPKVQAERQVAMIRLSKDEHQ